MENKMTAKELLKKILENPLPTQYLKVIRDLIFKDFGGRRTFIPAGDTGYVLNEEQILTLSGASGERKVKMITEMMESYDQGCLYALVCDYPCKLMPDDYQLESNVPNRCCGEFI